MEFTRNFIRTKKHNKIFLASHNIDIAALYKGHSVIWVPVYAPHFNTYFNSRYGLLLVPVVTVFIGLFSRKYRILKALSVLCIILQVILFYSLLPGESNHLDFVILKDTVASITKPTEQASSFLSRHYNGGLVLVSSASSESFIFHTGLEKKTFITEGTGHFWHTSLVNPAKYANWIVFFPSYSDDVGSSLKNNQEFKNKFVLAFKNNTYVIYKKI